MAKEKRSAFIFVILLLLAVGWTIFLFYFGIDGIIPKTGIHSPYILIFIVALTTGASMFTTSSFYVTLSLIALQGYNPWLLGLISGTGIMLGDTFFYYLGKEARYLDWFVKTKFYKKLCSFVISKPKHVIQIFVFLYAAISPFPNDIIMMILGATNYKYKDFIIPLFFGDVLFMTFAAFVPGLFI